MNNFISTSMNNFYSTTIFRKTHPKFMTIIEKYNNMLSSISYNEEDFTYIGRMLLSHIANFDDSTLCYIEWFINDIYSMTNKLHDSSVVMQIMDDLSHLCQHILEYRNNSIRLSHKVHHEILCKISDEFIKVRSVICPLKHTNFNHNENDITGTNDLAFVLWELRKHNQIIHYYYMIYLYDITLRMQKIKSLLIKYDLARRGKQIGKNPLDIIINELLLKYVEYNKEHREYCKKIYDMNYYLYEHPLMNPTINNLISMYP